jgi:threonine dehydratase
LPSSYEKLARISAFLHVWASLMPIAFTDILEARRRIAGRVLRTPMRRSPALERATGAPLWG